jgi:hypothetical protein
MKRLVLLLIACTLPVVANAAIGSVSEQAGTTVEIRRGNNSIPSAQNTSIESMDTVVVGSRSETNITFRDNTRVKIKENSRLLIDDFVFDASRSDAGSTVQYASGQIAKNNQQNMNIRTPTASIAVRGTDFAMSVDEAGRSFVVLLPSCSDPRQVNNYEIAGNCTVGVIDVETSAGFVTLNQPFTATYVTDSAQPPLPPVRIEANIANISNDLALRKPENIVAAERSRAEARERDRNRSQVSSDEQKAANDRKSEERSDTSTTILSTVSTLASGPVDSANPCWPFNSCGNERGRNWYYREDDQRNNVISIRSGERNDSTIYNISINDNDLQTRINGDPSPASNRITVRIWNR